MERAKTPRKEVRRGQADWKDVEEKKLLRGVREKKKRRNMPGSMAEETSEKSEEKALRREFKLGEKRTLF